MVGEPGIPNVIIGNIAPVEAELLADSGAATPSIAPFPNSSGSFADSFATPYDINAPGVAPAAGKIPTKKPKEDPIKVPFHAFLKSLIAAKILFALTSTFDMEAPSREVFIVHSISPMPYTPIAKTKNRKPCIKPIIG